MKSIFNVNCTILLIFTFLLLITVPTIAAQNIYGPLLVRPEDPFSPTYKTEIVTNESPNFPIISTLVVTSYGSRLFAAVGTSLHEYTLTGTFVKNHASAPDRIDTFVLYQGDTALLALVNGSLYRLELDRSGSNQFELVVQTSSDKNTTGAGMLDSIQHIIKPGTFFYKNNAVSDTDSDIFFITKSGIYQYVPTNPTSPTLLINHTNILVGFGRGLLVTNDHIYRSYEGGIAQWTRSTGTLIKTMASGITNTTSNLLLLQDDILFSEKQGFWNITDGTFIRIISGLSQVNTGVVGPDSVFVVAQGYPYPRQYRSIRGVWKDTLYGEERECVATNPRDEYSGCEYPTTLALTRDTLQSQQQNTLIVAGNGSICIYQDIRRADKFLFCGLKDVPASVSVPMLAGIVGGVVVIIGIGAGFIYAKILRQKRYAARMEERIRAVEEERAKDNMKWMSSSSSHSHNDDRQKSDCVKERNSAVEGEPETDVKERNSAVEGEPETNNILSQNSFPSPDEDCQKSNDDGVSHSSVNQSTDQLRS